MIQFSFFFILFSLALSFIFVPICRFIAFKWNIIDIPDGRIKVHSQATPYLGGVALFSAVIITVIVGAIYQQSYSYIGLLFGLFILLCVGLLDDLYPISPLQKVIGQIIAVHIFISSGICLQSGAVSFLFIYIATLLWFVAIINALNLIDIMDGLAGTTALCSIIFFAIFAFFLKDFDLLLICLAFIGGLLGFLYFNKPKATIYLGDAGSLVLGGILAALPLILSKNSPNFVKNLIAGIVLLGIPLAETFLLIVIRTYKGIPFYMGSPDHFASYLRKKGWKDYQILRFITALSVFLGFVACCVFWNITSYCATFAQLLILFFFVIKIVYL